MSTDTRTEVQIALSDLYDLKSIAERYVNGIDTLTLHEGWGITEHLIYITAMNDAISAVELVPDSDIDTFSRFDNVSVRGEI